MPTMQDFRRQQDAKPQKSTAAKSAAAKTKSPPKNAVKSAASGAKKSSAVKKPVEGPKIDSKPSLKRRPGRDESLYTSASKEIPMMETNAGQENQKPTAEDVAYFEAEAQAEKDTPKVEIHFKGSELLRARFPKPFDVAEAVATDWGRDGKFENLPISHPLAQWAAQQGLLKAKEIEKKVMESPALEKAAMTALTVGMKAQGLISQLRGRLKR